MQWLWQPVLHFQPAEDTLKKIPAWLPLQMQPSPQALEEDSRPCQTKKNDNLYRWLMRSLKIAKSINLSPLCLISSRLSAFSCLFPNTEFYFLSVVLQTFQFLLLQSPFCTEIPSCYAHHFIVKLFFFNFSCSQHPSTPFIRAACRFWCLPHLP